MDTVKTRLQALDEDELQLFEPDAPGTTDTSDGDVEKAQIGSSTTTAQPGKSRAKPTGHLELVKRIIARRIKHWGTLALLLRILKTEGLPGAFHGFGASMLGTFSQRESMRHDRWQL